MTSVTLSNSIASIEWGMFWGCTSLKSVTIPYSVTKIWDEAFSDCTSLMSVKVENKTPISIEEETFSNRREITLCVPAGCKSAYQDADYWKEFKYIVEIGDVNGDGKITPADAIMILYAYFGVNQTGFYSVAADLNGDREVTPADAIEALYKYFGDGNSNKVARSARPTTGDVKDPD